MSIKERLNIIVLLSVLTILGLYGYILKITLDIESELSQIERIEEYEQNISQLGLITEYYLTGPETRYKNAWFSLIDNIEKLSGEIDQFDSYHIIGESIPSIRSAFNLVVEMNEEPDLYADPDVQRELSARVSTRIRSDVRQLIMISYSISRNHLENINTLQGVQRLNFLYVLIPAILLICLLAYYMRQLIISSLQKLQKGTKAFASGRLNERIHVSRNDELGELAVQFNSMAHDLESLLEKEKILNQKLQNQAIALKKSNEELENFASVASHDLKEPLRMIRNFMQLLDQKYASKLDDTAKKYIHFAVDGSQRMTSLINDLLEFSHVDRKYTTFEKVDVNQVIREVIQYFEPKIYEQQADVTFEDMPSIEAIRVPFRMIFQNLIGNALKYHNPDVKQKIRIGKKELEHHWQFSVSDKGIGIQEEYHKDIFQLFKRLHSANEYGGTGMGLAMCKKIVYQHGGEIWIESEPGIGSIVYFTIAKKIT